MDLTDHVHLETPEQVELQFDLAGLGTRTAARIIDWLLKFAVSVALGIVASIAIGGLANGIGSEDRVRFLAMFVLIFAAMVWIFVDVLFEVWWNGQTPGKRMLGCRVVREGGLPIDFTSSCIRNVLSIVDFLPMYNLVGALLIASTAKHQRLGDMAAGTIVIRDRKVAIPGDPQQFVVGFANADIAFTAIQLSKCAPGDRQVLRSFLQRHDRIAPGPRELLTRQLFDTYSAKLGAEPTDVPPLGWLAALLRDLDRKAERGY